MEKKEVKKTRELQGAFNPINGKYLVTIKAIFKEDDEVVLAKNMTKIVDDTDEVLEVMTAFAERYHSEYKEDK